MFVVALFPVTLQVAPGQNRQPDASAVNVNYFSISKRAISIRPNKSAAGRKQRGGRKGETAANNWRRLWQDGEEGGSAERARVKVIRMFFGLKEEKGRTWVSNRKSTVSPMLLCVFPSCKFAVLATLKGTKPHERIVIGRRLKRWVEP